VTSRDLEGNTISWSSAGSLGFRGSRKGTPFAAQQAALTAANKAGESGLRTVEVARQRSGIGAGIGGARAVHGGHQKFASIKDVTPIAAQRLPSSEEEKIRNEKAEEGLPWP